MVEVGFRLWMVMVGGGVMVVVVGSGDGVSGW